MAHKKSWREKLDDAKGLPKVGKITGPMTAKWGRGTMVIPAPREVDALMRKVGKGKLVTINELRTALAKKHDVSMACPITTGIFAWIAAHAAQESLDAGAKRVTPFWRTLKNGGELNRQVSRRHHAAQGAAQGRRTSGRAKGEAFLRRRVRQGAARL